MRVKLTVVGGKMNIIQNRYMSRQFLFIEIFYHIPENTSTNDYNPFEKSSEGV